jgi:hypothetical protein
MKGNKGEDKLTIKKVHIQGLTSFFSLRHVIAAWCISSTTALLYLVYHCLAPVNIGEIRNIHCHEGVFPLTLLSMAGNNNLLNATTKNILTTKSLLINSFEISCKRCLHFTSIFGSTRTDLLNWAKAVSFSSSVELGGSFFPLGMPSTLLTHKLLICKPP